MNPGRALLGLVTSLAAADIAAQNHVRLDYFVAAFTVFGAIFGVVKGYKWWQTNVKEIVIAQFEVHGERHKRLEDKINGLIKAIESLPCGPGRICDGRPLLTPVPFTLTPKENANGSGNKGDVG